MEDKKENIHKIVSIYDYYIRDYLSLLSSETLEFQIKECLSIKILFLDYCGISSIIYSKICDFDIYLIEDPNEDVISLCRQYDVVYILVYELQPIIINYPCLRIVFLKKKIIRIEVGE